MHVAITGASGLIGSRLVPDLAAAGHRVSRLVRRAPTGPQEIRWSPDQNFLDTQALAGVDAVVHLAGEGVAAHRWNDAHKRRVLDSRVAGTGLVSRVLAGLGEGHRTLVCASAIGYYGDRGDEVLTEDSASGEGFLADVCRRWESAADPARAAGLRVVHVRIGIVQTPEGGALRQQLPLFRLGLGGRLGSGRQYQSWVTIDDVVGVLHHAVTTPDLSGPVNATAPNPVTNAEYTRVLGRVLGRPAVLPVPRLGPALLLGREGAEEVALASQRVLPERAVASGYHFRHTDLETGLRHVLDRPAGS